jgi:hypothetical protein
MATKNQQLIIPVGEDVLIHPTDEDLAKFDLNRECPFCSMIDVDFKACNSPIPIFCITYNDMKEYHLLLCCEDEIHNWDDVIEYRVLNRNEFEVYRAQFS